MFATARVHQPFARFTLDVAGTVDWFAAKISLGDIRNIYYINASVRDLFLSSRRSFAFRGTAPFLLLLPTLFIRTSSARRSALPLWGRVPVIPCVVVIFTTFCAVLLVLLCCRKLMYCWRRAGSVSVSSLSSRLFLDHPIYDRLQFILCNIINIIEPLQSKYMLDTKIIWWQCGV